MSGLEVIQCCGWRMEVMELFAFCQPVTLASEPSFSSHTSLNITIASCAFCLWPSLRDGLGFKLCLLSYWLNLSQYCMCVSTFSLCTQVGSVCAFSCIHPRMYGEGKPLRHRVIIPTLAQWPRLNPGFDPPPNLSLQALG